MLATTGHSTGVRYSTSAWLPDGLHAIDHMSQNPVVCPVLHPLTIHLLSPGFISLPGNMLSETLKIFAKIHCSPLVLGAGHFVVEDYQLDQAWFPLCKSILTTPNRFLVFMCLEMVSRKIWSTSFLGTELRLISLYFPSSSFLFTEATL